ncbi:hypothetical protein [Lutibacter sp.]|uniref:hypothetical protein n=1 Tax=Lutibacter sp. TaxID=1925666 RepID=UPI002733195B|nr:hypothetical protein [Lutibacter sp.]MDP3314266.1 hypothetical protein [Lutibacter sp.]
MEQNKQSNSKAIIIGLAVLLAGALGYTFYSSSEHKEETTTIQNEKLEIEQNLDSMIVRYEEAIALKTSMSGELAIERDKIIALRDSVRGLKSINSGLISKFRKQLAQMELTNKNLVAETENLTQKNKTLTTNLDSANVKISKEVSKNENLTVQNQGLSEKVAIGSIIKVNTVKVLAMKERSSGKMVETSRAKSADAFRINFTVSKNEISEKGERQIYIQVVDASGKTIANKGEISLFDSKTVGYSDKTSVNYLNEAIDVISLVEVAEGSLNAGLYVVNVFVEKRLAGTTQIILK